MDACEVGNGIHPVVLTGGAQFGKTVSELNSIFYACDTSPRPYLVLLPSLNEVNTWSYLKLDPNVKDAPRLARVVYRHKSRSTEGSTNAIKRFRGGRVDLATAGASKCLQMCSVACVAADEVDQYDTDQEGRVGRRQRSSCTRAPCAARVRLLRSAVTRARFRLPAARK